MNKYKKSRWILRQKPRNKAKIRLFCFPYAGSSGMVTFKFLVDTLPDSIEVCPIELPGRGARMTENLIGNLDKVVNEILSDIKDYLDLPFIFFGHSMGALICYELTHKIRSIYNRSPLKLYVSAHNAPFLARNGKIMHKLDETEFKSELIKINGIAQDILEHAELMELMLPIIKNDYKLCETYKFSQKEKLNCPITAFGGTYDKDVTENQLWEWKELTTSNFELDMFEGDHFFIVKEKYTFTSRFSQMLLDDIKHIKK